MLVYGPPKGEAPRTGFHGILAYLRDTIEEARSDGYREYMMSFMSATPCPACRGKRLRPESLAVKIGGLSIADFTALPLNRALSAGHQPEIQRARSADCRAASGARLWSGWNSSAPWA